VVLSRKFVEINRKARVRHKLGFAKILWEKEEKRTKRRENL